MILDRNRTALSVWRAVIGSVALVAVFVQLITAMKQPTFHVANFFGYFTILSNTLAGLIFMYVATQNLRPSHQLDIVRGAATLCLAMVGLIFWTLLAHLESNVLPWVNVVVHYVMPVTVVADWLIDPPRTTMTNRDTLWWLIFPLLYVVYTLVRGSIVHWYPYPFFDVNAIGLAMVATYVAGIFGVTLVLAALVATSGNALGVRYRRSVDPTAKPG